MDSPTYNVHKKSTLSLIFHPYPQTFPVPDSFRHNLNSIRIAQLSSLWLISTNSPESELEASMSRTRPRPEEIVYHVYGYLINYGRIVEEHREESVITKEPGSSLDVERLICEWWLNKLAKHVGIHCDTCRGYVPVPVPVLGVENKFVPIHRPFIFLALAVGDAEKPTPNAEKVRRLKEFLKRNEEPEWRQTTASYLPIYRINVHARAVAIRKRKQRAAAAAATQQAENV
ncbi:hypothetical protein BXZ70DRAFT_662102 [Cristinia sonorae]|uniref:Uncharacterized protein n=1 Tax=Cristinia sonorae TaxID=1940300 RepID=A0A8K0UG25_9AGAR|nr:hypothetical protein BXZ70DRAFT_662102 [Cristinia sonorae]